MCAGLGSIQTCAAAGVRPAPRRPCPCVLYPELCESLSANRLLGHPATSNLRPNRCRLPPRVLSGSLARVLSDGLCRPPLCVQRGGVLL
eukprot:6043008-Prymnesium_polylepis.1